MQSKASGRVTCRLVGLVIVVQGIIKGADELVC